MALPILDGNQSAATLSTIVAGGQHIPAHTVVSLGAQAISEITSAVSGVSVSISGTQTTTFGAVTGSVTVLNFPASQSVTFSQASVTFGATTGSVSVLNLPSTQTIAGTVTVGASSVTFNAYVGQRGDGSWQPISLQTGSNYVNANVQNSVTIGSLPAISGTVTANVPNADTFIKPSGTGGFGDALEAQDDVSAEMCVAVHIQDQSGNVLGASKDFPISGTVTVGALPSGSLTTRFGSVTTANTAQITSAVTNTSRKYLLAQNISTGTVTIGIGFSPTTTQGIQLAAGGGLTFDAFCPTGAVYWLGAVTGAAFTILEG